MGTQKLRLLALVALLVAVLSAVNGSRSPSVQAQTGGASITTDKTQYQVGDTARICYRVPGPGNITITDIQNGSSHVILSGVDDGTGDCGTATITPPTGQECVRLDYSGSRGTASAQTCFQVVPARGSGVGPTPTAGPGTPPSPQLPVPSARFFGSVTVGGGAAAPGAAVVASIGGVACGFGSVSGGSYSVDIQAIAGCISPGSTITFAVNGAVASTTGTLPTTAGTAVQLNLVIPTGNSGGPLPCTSTGTITACLQPPSGNGGSNPVTITATIDRGEGSTYYNGDSQTVCITVSRPIDVNLTDIVNGVVQGTQDLGVANSGTSCTTGTVTAPFGQETYRVDAIENGQVLASVQMHFVSMDRPQLPNATVTLSFTPSSSAPVGSDIQVHIQASDPAFNTVKVQLPCGTPQVYELGAPAADFTWHTGGCNPGPFTAIPQARPGGDSNWDRGISGPPYGYQLTQSATAVICPKGQFRAEYYDDPTSLGSPSLFLLEDPAYVTCEATIDHSWGTASLASGIGSTYMARWTGRFDFSAGSYTFSINTDDGMRLFVDDNLLIDGWKDQQPTDYSQSMSLNAGEHTVRVEYYQRFCCAAEAHVRWQITDTAPPRAPSWKFLVLVFDQTDVTFLDGSVTRHVVAQMTSEERQSAASTAKAFATIDVPALTSQNMWPTVDIRYPGTLTSLSAMNASGPGREPQASDVAAYLAGAFDSVFVIWPSRGTDVNTSQPYTLNFEGGLTWRNGLAQTFSEFTVDSTQQSQNIFKHEWGHAIASYYDASGEAPKPSVNNHQIASYVNCSSGGGYVLVDQTEENPIPNSTYNNDSGFTHDFYSGTTKLLGAATCLGIPPAAWASGGPATGPSGPRSFVSTAAEVQPGPPIP